MEHEAIHTSWTRLLGPVPLEGDWRRGGGRRTRRAFPCARVKSGPDQGPRPSAHIMQRRSGAASRAREEDPARSAAADTLLDKAEQSVVADAPQKPWSLTRRIAICVLFVGGLWIFCYVLTRLLIYVMLRLNL